MAKKKTTRTPIQRFVKRRIVVGYEESGQRFTMLEQERWDYMHGTGWVHSFEPLFHTKRGA